MRGLTTTGSPHSLVARQRLASFDEQYEIWIADRADERKEIDLVEATIVQIRQLVQYSPKKDGRGAKWKNHWTR
jgi:hypothetical protein